MKGSYFDAFWEGLVHGHQQMKLATGGDGTNIWCSKLQRQQSLHWWSGTSRWRVGTLMLFWQDWLMVMRGDEACNNGACTGGDDVSIQCSKLLHTKWHCFLVFTCDVFI